VSGYVTFQLCGRELACPTAQVREVVRLAGLQVLPGLPAGISGLIELRGAPLPVADVRDDAAARGDVLVLAGDVEQLGVVVDRVIAVHGDGALVPDDGPRPPGLPSYVVALLRHQPGGRRVLLVDLRQLRAVALPA
jgi:chemotaxis signal transduction protein